MIGAEGAKTPAGERDMGDRAGAQRRGPPANRSRLERKSIGMCNI
ncbi:hypothetical protein [Bacillus sp. X1(2014)]|nr:hypothetical protein [Bacillus sp. X1(2014)]